MHSKDLHTLVQSGVRPVVTFRKGVEESETYLEAGMRGRITGSRAAHDGLFHFTVDLTGFEEINAGFETANYYDKEGAAVLTARQAGFYPEDGLEALYVDADLANILELVPDARTALHEEYLKTRATPAETYLEWLENKAPLSGGVHEAGVD